MSQAATGQLLEIVMPEEPNGKIAFSLTCSVWGQIRQSRTITEGQKLRDGLPGFTIINGEHRTRAVSLGE